MKNLVFLNVFLVITSVLEIGFCDYAKKVRFPISRSYQVPYQILKNDHELQYLTTGQPYTLVPAAFLTSQVGYVPASITSVLLQQQEDSKPVHEMPETSQSLNNINKPILHFFKQKPKVTSYESKRYGPTMNSIFTYPQRLKKLIPNTKLLSVSGVDLSDQSSLGSASNLYSTTIGPVGNIYGTSKIIDYQHKTQLPGNNIHSNVYRPKGTTHLHPSMYPKKMQHVIKHKHKGHTHSHYFPYKSFDLQKPQPTIQFASPNYVLPSPTLSPLGHTLTTEQENTQSYSYALGNQIKFLGNQETLQYFPEKQQANNSPGELTRAVLNNHAIINNYDTALPFKVPKKKPFKFEVENMVNQDNKNNELIESQSETYLQNSPQIMYSNPYESQFSGLDPFNTVSSTVTNPLQYYPSSTNYQNNQMTQVQDRGMVDTEKIPVAVIKGIHNLYTSTTDTVTPTIKRQFDGKSEELKKDFTPSKRISDWIPMALNTHSINSGKDDFNDEFVISSQSRPNKSSKHQIEEIISGKIPREFTPILNGGTLDGISDIASPNIAGTSGEDKRKNSLLNVHPSSADTSNLVVSSVLKFS